MAKRVLGKGLGAIISSSTTIVDEFEENILHEGDRIVDIPIDIIKPNPDQPRTYFDEDEIRGLAESIESFGIIQPIIVRKNEEDYYVVAGERRLRAAKLACLDKIRSIIIHAEEEKNLTIALIENIQRKDLDPIEEARAYRVLIDRFNLKQQDIATRVGKERATIANILRLLNLPDEIQQAISDGKISIGHAKVLLSVSAKRQIPLCNEIIRNKLSVRDVERIVENEKGEKNRSNRKSISKDPHIKILEDRLISILGTKVEIKHIGEGGRIEISYYSLDDFDRIMEILDRC
ncbi:MAG: ParB/RepB/Spo0J family partition protein [Spirochaetota bacterium]|nr:ParB/RepB/Spo0J family partition protein [Spirochaetota bacterium]